MNKQGWQRFLTLCQSAQSSAELDELFMALCTAEERKQLAFRVDLIKELLAGEKTQRRIAADLGVSIAKITRGSNMLKTIKPKLRAFFEKYL